MSIVYHVRDRCITGRITTRPNLLDLGAIAVTGHKRNDSKVGIKCVDVHKPVLKTNSTECRPEQECGSHKR